MESLFTATEVKERKTDLVQLARGEFISPALTPLPISLSDLATAPNSRLKWPRDSSYSSTATCCIAVCANAPYDRAAHLVAGTDPHATRGYRVAPERVDLRCYKESPQ